MKFAVLLVLTSIGLVLSFPRKHQYPAIEHVYAGGDGEEVNEDVGHRIFKKSISANSNNENLVIPEGTHQEPCRLSLDLTAMEMSQDPYNEDEVQDYLPEVMPPRIPFNNWTPYDLDYPVQEPALYRSTYNSYMPYIYPNPVPSVRSLPPVISTHIYETIPEMPEIDGIDVDGLSNNDLYFPPPYVRAVRSREEDYLEQLEKDAMMPNLLPTMPFPYMRTGSGSSYQRPAAMFPRGSGSDCALPFLLNCSPKVYYGDLTQNDGYSLQSTLTTNMKNSVGPNVTVR